MIQHLTTDQIIVGNIIAYFKPEEPKIQKAEIISIYKNDNAGGETYIESMWLEDKSVILNWHIQGYMGIPLSTHELESGFGLKQVTHTWNDGTTSIGVYWMRNYFIAYTGKDSQFGIRTHANEGIFLRPVFYVHEIQNISKLIVGEELKYSYEKEIGMPLHKK